PRDAQLSLEVAPPSQGARLHHGAAALLKPSRAGQRAPPALAIAGRGDLRSLGERGELGPHHLRIEVVAAGMDREAAVDPGHDPLSAELVGIAAYPLRDQLGVLDVR